ncbi:hypothetical protein LTR85_000206 [Meristemomyces frigidus]|nr:hypothetical protein LTR85_000206 [Meristemomyces frigidus]
MEPLSSRAVKATSSLSVRRQRCSRSPNPFFAPPRCLHTTPSREATPLPHPTVPGPPPQAPQASVTFPQDRIAKKRQQAELLKQGQQARVDAGKPTSALRKRFWKNVSVKDTDEGLQVLLDTRPVRTASRQVLQLPHAKRALATSIAVEWDQLTSAQQALKQHFIPMTSLTSRAVDIERADRDGDPKIRDALVPLLLRYLGTDTLLCWAPEKNIHEPAYEGQVTLRHRQREVAEPIIAYLNTHIFPGVTIQPILDEDSIMPTKQPEMTREVIRGWVAGLPAFELAALERGVLATKSLLVAARLLVEWSREFSHLRRDREGSAAGAGHGSGTFGVEEAAEAASLEVMHQIGQWGEVEDTHDVEREDLRRQLGSVVLLLPAADCYCRKRIMAFKRMAANTEEVAKEEAPKKKVRRMKLLAPETISEHTKKIFELNATQSPLLRLPPELRNRIWYLALGGKTVHVYGYNDHRRQRVYHSICRASADDPEVAAASMTALQEGMQDPAWLLNYEDHDQECLHHSVPNWRAANSQLPLSLLRASRQVHQEAALIPYQHNTFAFVHFNTVGPFLKTLVPAQARAIEQLTVADTDALTPYTNPTFAKLLRSKLKGLKAFTCNIDLQWCIYSGDRFADRFGAGKAWAACLMQFQHLAAVSATVTVAAVKRVGNAPVIKRGGTVERVPAMSKEVARSWAREVEQQLVRPAE